MRADRFLDFEPPPPELDTLTLRFWRATWCRVFGHKLVDLNRGIFMCVRCTATARIVRIVKGA